MKKKAILSISFFLIIFLFAVVPFAQGGVPPPCALDDQSKPQLGILPRTSCTADECNHKYDTFTTFYDQGYKSLDQTDRGQIESLLGCAIKTGKIRLFMIPFFITRLIEFLVGLAGLIAVLFIVIGGYKFVTGGIAEDKEAGKKTVLHAIIGLVVALSAYIIINFIQAQLTQ